MKISDHINDLESAFRMDCSDEDIKTDKEAKQTYKVLQKLKKKTKEFNSFLCKQGVVKEDDAERLENMKRIQNFKFILEVTK